MLGEPLKRETQTGTRAQAVMLAFQSISVSDSVSIVGEGLGRFDPECQPLADC